MYILRREVGRTRIAFFVIRTLEKDLRSFSSDAGRETENQVLMEQKVNLEIGIFASQGDIVEKLVKNGAKLLAS